MRVRGARPTRPDSDRPRKHDITRKGHRGNLFRVLVFSWLPLFCVGLGSQSIRSKRDHDIAMAMLRHVHEDVVRHYYDRTFHGFDLEGQFKAAEQRIEAAGTLTDAVAIVSELLAGLD